MNKSVLISIRPRWIDLISRGEKTIEVRKSRPKMDTPFKCYIYQTGEYIPSYVLSPYSGRRKPGKVMAEFTCDRIDRYLRIGTTGAPRVYYMRVDPEQYTHSIDYSPMCLSPEEFANYGGGKQLFGWYISELKIYTEPKDLSEFSLWNADPRTPGVPANGWYYKPLVKAPQSYCFVYGLED